MFIQESIRFAMGDRLKNMKNSDRDDTEKKLIKCILELHENNLGTEYITSQKTMSIVCKYFPTFTYGKHYILPGGILYCLYHCIPVQEMASLIPKEKYKSKNPNISKLKKQIKHCKNLLEKVMLEKELNNAYKKRKIQKCLKK